MSSANNRNEALVQHILEILERFWNLYNRYRTLVSIILYGGSFCVGFFVLAPIVKSQLFKLILFKIEENAPLSTLLNVNFIILDNLVICLIPYFAVLSGGCVAYHFFNENLDVLNRTLSYFRLLTGAPGKLLISLFMGTAGIGSYACFNGSTQVGIIILSLSCVYFGLPGVLFMKYAHLPFEKNVFLDKYAILCAILYGFLAIAGLMYEVISTYLRLWYAIVEIAKSIS